MSLHRSTAPRPRAFAVSLLLLSPPLLAAEPSAESGTVTLEPVIVVEEAQKPYTVDATASATKLGLSLRDTPQSVTVVTSQMIQDQNLQSLRDVLDSVTGVYSYAYDTERVVFVSRGFVIDNTLYDGVPVPTDLSTSSAQAELDTALYERIEVVRGATGLLSGAGSPSAAINLVRKHADSAELTGSLSLGYGSWDDFRSVADVQAPLTADGSVRARAVAVYQNGDSYIDLYTKEKQVFYGVVDADLTPHTRLSFGYDYQDHQPQGNTWGSFPLFFNDGTRTDWPTSITTATDWSYWNKTTQTAFAELRHDFGNDWTLRATAQHRKLDSETHLFYVYGFPDPETGEGLLPYAYFDTARGNQNSLDAYLSGPFRLFGRQHELVVGAMGSWLRTDNYEYAPPEELPAVGNFFEWDGSYAEPDWSSEALLAGQTSTDQSAAYAALRLSLADPLKLIAGVRASRWDSSHYYIYDGSLPFVQDHDEFTPYAGLIYDFSEQWSAFASYTSIFNPQNRQRIDASYLDPLDGYSTEVGIKGSHFDQRLNTALTLFDTRQDNVADTVVGYINGDLNRPAYNEVDGTRTRGFELEASGEILDHWSVSLGVSNYEMEDGDGNRIKGYMPRTLVRAFTSYTLPGALQNLTVGGGVKWQSRNYVEVERPAPDYETSFESALDEVAQDSFALLSLLARYQFTPQIAAQLNGDNLGDEKYYVIDEYGNLYWGEPANVTLTLSLDF